MLQYERRLSSSERQELRRQNRSDLIKVVLILLGFLALCLAMRSCTHEEVYAKGPNVQTCSRESFNAWRD